MVTLKVIKSAPPEEIIELYKAGGWWTEEDDSERAAENVRKMLLGSFCVMGAFNESGQLVGMGRAISDGCSDAYIQDVVVLKNYRKKGIGAQIIKALTDHCLQHGIVWLGLISEPGVESFYEQLNFYPMKNYVPMKYKKP